MTDPIIFTGAVHLSQKQFDKHYAPRVLQAISANRTIRVGCAAGCDALVQNLCIAKEHYNVEVYVPSEEDLEKVHCQSEKFKRIDVDGGFKRRDRAMWDGCKEAYAHLSQYGGAASGAAATLIACAARRGKFGPEFTHLDGYAIVDVLRGSLEQFQPEVQKTVLQAEEALEK